MSATGKRVALRTCVICRQKFDKRQVLRLVRTPDGVQVDPSGKMNGRGAYVCENDTCRQQLTVSDVLAKALRCTLSMDDRERLRQAVS